MHKLSKADEQRLESIRVGMLSAKRKHDLLLMGLNKDLQNLIRSFNKENAEVIKQIESEYRQLTSEFIGFSSEMVGRMESYSDDRSDNWHDGEPGYKYRMWIEEWEQVGADLNDLLDFDFNISVTLNWLPEPIDACRAP